MDLQRSSCGRWANCYSVVPQERCQISVAFFFSQFLGEVYQRNGVVDEVVNEDRVSTVQIHSIDIFRISMKSEAQLSNVQEHSFPIVKYQEGCILKVVHQFIPKEGYSNIFKCKCLPNIPVLFIVNKTNNNSNVRKRDPSTDERARKTLQRIRRHTVGDGLPEKKEKTVWSQGRRSLFNTRTRRSSQSGLLGSFEESALHGRLKPTASVSGFSIELSKMTSTLLYFYFSQ